MENAGKKKEFSTLHSQHSIRENAIFIADAHYPHHGEEFLELLKALESGRIETPQLFLMGDIFDLLFGCGDYIRSFVPEAIERLQRLSERIEIHYLEGNHDFCLKTIFPNINVVSRSRQPLLMEWKGRKVALAHGDRYDTGLGYGVYTFLLRSCRAMCLLLPFEKTLIDSQLAMLRKKKICRKMEDFEKKVSNIIKYYPEDIDLIVEGHFHQGRKIGRYVALPSLACQKEVGVVLDGEIVFVKPGEILVDRR
jgi:UDP-2,3-diacylglucosamine hydrolase